MRIKIISIPEAQLGLDVETPLAELEAGEIYESTEGTINKVDDDANWHEDGGEIVDDAVRILEDTSDKRKDIDSRLLKLTPEEIEEATGVKVKKPMTHSKAYEAVTNHYAKRVKKIESKIKKNVKAVEGWGDQYSKNSMDVNIQALEAIPSDKEVFDVLFDMQESKKLEQGIGKYKCGGKNKMRKGQTGLNNYSVGMVTNNGEQSKLDKFLEDFRLSRHARTAAQTAAPPTTPPQQVSPTDEAKRMIGQYINANKQKFKEPLQWYDTIMPVKGMLDSRRRYPVQYFGTESTQVTPRLISDAPMLDQGNYDYNAALSMISDDPSSQANIANLYSQKYRLNNQTRGAVQNQNQAILSQADMAEAMRRNQQSVNDVNARKAFDDELQTSLAMQQAQFNTSLGSLATRYAQNAKFNRDGQLITNMFRYFDRYGNKNDEQYNFNRATNPIAGQQSGQRQIETIAQKDPYTGQIIYVNGIRTPNGGFQRIGTIKPPRFANGKLIQ